MSPTTLANRVIRTLSRTPLFASLEAEDIRALDARCLWRRGPAGEWVIDYQADDQDVFFVFSGHARVVITTGGREMILRDIREGEYFGQYSAIDGTPRSSRSPIRSSPGCRRLCSGKRSIPIGECVRAS